MGYVQASDQAHIIRVERERGVRRRRRRRGRIRRTVLDCERIILHLHPYHQSIQGYGVHLVVVEPWRRIRRMRMGRLHNVQTYDRPISEEGFG